MNICQTSILDEVAGTFKNEKIESGKKKRSQMDCRRPCEPSLTHLRKKIEFLVLTRAH